MVFVFGEIWWLWCSIFKNLRGRGAKNLIFITDPFQKFCLTTFILSTMASSSVDVVFLNVPAMISPSERTESDFHDVKVSLMNKLR